MRSRNNTVTHLRAFVPTDAEAIARIFYEAVHKLGPAVYSPEQLKAWAPAPLEPAQIVARATDGRVLLVAANPDNQALAYGELEPDGHIDHLYCHPSAARQGLATAIYEALERIARERGIATLYVEASELARPLFARHGFRLVQRQDFQRHGVVLHNYRMQKTL